MMERSMMQWRVVRSVLTAFGLSTSLLAGSSHGAANDDGDRWDTVMTIQPARNSSYNETFASRRRPVAMRDDPKMALTDKGRAAVVDFAQCLYDYDKSGARRMLEARPGSALRALVEGYASSQCILRGFVVFRPSAFQGALFTVVYRTEYKHRDLVLSPEPINYASMSGAQSVPKAALFVALRQFAECAVRADPKTAQKLVLSDVAGSAEDTAFVSFGPAMSPCVASGQNVKLTKETVKATVAEVLYRQALRAASSSAVPK